MENHNKRRDTKVEYDLWDTAEYAIDGFPAFWLAAFIKAWNKAI